MSDSLQPQGLYSPWSSLGQNTGVGSLSLFQGNFPTEGLNPGLPRCRQILYKLSPQGSPRILEWVAYPFSRGSSQPRYWTRVFCLAGGFFTNWAMREALCGYRRGNSNLMWSNCKWTLQWKMAGVRESARICSFVLVPIVHNIEVQLFSECRLHVLAQTSGWHLWFLAAQHSVQFSRSVMSFSLRSYGLQHARFPCPSSTPEAWSNSRPLSQWCHVILCHPLLFLPSIFPSIRVFSNELALQISWPKHWIAAATAAKSLQSCPTLCDPVDGNPTGSSVPGILQARTLEWVAISFSSAWKWKVKVKSLSRVQLSSTSWTAAYQAPPSMGFSRQEYWNGVPLPSECYFMRTIISIWVPFFLLQEYILT